MPLFWIDTGVLIQAWNGAYAPDIVPGFWEALKKGVADGFLRSPEKVLVEIQEQKDDLSKWVSANLKSLFVPASEAVQAAYGPISSHVVNGSYNPAYVRKFLKGADGWLIAHAQIDTGTVVTWELPRRRSRVKIPEVSKHFGVECRDPFQLLRALGVKLQIASS